MSHDPLPQRGGLLVSFQREGITVYHFTHVLIGPHRKPMLTGLIVRVCVHNVILRCFFCGGSWVNDHRPPSRKTPVSIEGRLGLNNPTAHYSKPLVPCFLMLVNVVQHGSVLYNIYQHSAFRLTPRDNTAFNPLTVLLGSFKGFRVLLRPWRPPRTVSIINPFPC